MRKLSKTQREIEELAKRVPALTDAQKEWAARRYVYPRSVYSDTESTSCPNCHGRIGLKKGARSETARCPHCGAKVNVFRHFESRDTRMRIPKNYHQENFFEVMNVVGGWQVTRLIYMQRYCYVRKENTPWEYHEVCQAWNNPAYATTYFRAYPKKFIPNYCFNPYSLHSWGYEVNPDEETCHRYVEQDNVLEARKAGSENYFGTHDLCFGAKILPYYKQRGVDARLVRNFSHNAMWAFEMLSHKNYKPMYETMLKGGDYKVLDDVKCYNDERHFKALCICKRNGYDYKKDKESEREWLDLVRMLIASGLDYTNPHYVCPDDLHAMHQHLVHIRQRRHEEERLKEAMRKNDEYRARIARYLDMDIRGNGLYIAVLPSIKAFKDEGDHLHHCVYRCSYYDKKDSLILSARGEDGKRWETIEVSLKSYKILQCYGYGDKYTEKHKEIEQLVTDNMWQIKQRARARA